MFIYKDYPKNGEVTQPKSPDFDRIYDRIKLLSNRKKFDILKVTQKEKKNITDLSKELGLAYNKCSNYVTELEKERFVQKVREGREVYVINKMRLSEDSFRPKDEK